MNTAPETARPTGPLQYPKALYHADGKTTTVARDEDHEETLMAAGCWSADANAHLAQQPAQTEAPLAGEAGQTEAQPSENDLLVFIAEMYDVKMGKARKHLEEHGREAVLLEMKEMAEEGQN